jgi:serine/threonine protein kinase/Tfp pilus assembly protein PilF
MIGQTISHYKILEEIGAGGMGVVYKALDTKLDRIVALKFLPPHISINKEEKKRFIHEAKAAAALNHINIVTIYEINDFEDQTYIAMEHLEGETLKDKIASGPLPINNAIDIVIQIAEGLQEAHQNHIVHRDIKAANIIITDKGQVKILDFGLAKLRGVTKLTKEGTTLGTVAYMSPEQASGDKVDHRSDIWSLGVLLYEMITGQLPFRGEYEQAIMYAIMNEEPEPITGLRTGVPRELERIVNKTLNKNISARYQNIADMIVDLKNLITKSEKATKEPKTGGMVKKRGLPQNLFKWMGLILLAVLVVAGYLFLKEKPKPEKTVGQEKSAADKIFESKWKNSIAVLPFTNISADKEQEYFCDGMTEDIITKLTHIKDLKVISRTSVMKYKKTEKSIRDIGKELTVDNILEGSVRKDKNRIRITAQLIRVIDDAHLWANNYDRNLESIFEVQDEVSKAIAQALEVTLTPETIQTFKASQTQNLQAYEYYLKGMHIFNNKYIHTFNEADFSTAVRMLETALEIDPNYIGAYSGLVWVYTNHYIFRRTESDFNMALKIAGKIKKLAPDSAAGYGNMATLFLLKNKYDQAYDYNKTAISKAPNLALLNYSFGFFYHKVGLYQRAIKYCTRAMELDPLLLHPYLTTIRSLIYSGNYKKAGYYLKKVADIYPDHPRIIDVFCQLSFRMSNYGEVEQWIKKLEKVYPEYENIKRWKMILYAARGERKNALALQYQDSEGFALLGLKEKALAIIQENQDKDKFYYDYLYLINNPHYDNLRDDPRFQEIVKKAKVLYDAGLIKYSDL